jgi:hypothetical protein
LKLTNDDIRSFAQDDSNTLYIEDHSLFLISNTVQPSSYSAGLLTYLKHPESGIEYKQLFIMDIQQLRDLFNAITDHLNVVDKS